jgi:predicted anti-sigma-YlaC factor YlaD
MTCAEAVAQLGGYLDGQLAPSVRAELDAHLAACARCRAQFAREAEFEAVVARSLRAAPDPAQDDAVWERALAASFATGATGATGAAGSAAPPAATRAPWWARFRHPPSRRQLRWFALAASLALLATFSMAGFGLRRALHATAPSATDQQHALPGAVR